VALTPYSKNAWQDLDHKTDEDQLAAGDPVTEMEMYFERETEKLLEKYCGPELKDYDPLGTLGIRDTTP